MFDCCNSLEKSFCRRRFTLNLASLIQIKNISNIACTEILMTAKLLCISKFKQLAIKSKVTRYASKRPKEHCKLYLD